jgi:hypothetical protein
VGSAGHQFGINSAARLQISCSGSTANPRPATIDNPGQAGETPWMRAPKGGRFYCDTDWNCLNDTLHGTIEEAEEAARWNSPPGVRFADRER